MNFLLRKRINNRRWFLRKKAKGAAQHDDDMDMVPKSEQGFQAISPPALPPTHHMPSSGVPHHPVPQTGVPQSHQSHHLNPLLAAALVKQRSPSSAQMPPSLTIGGTPMIDHPTKDISVN